jgi:hypothetical protein
VCIGCLFCVTSRTCLLHLKFFPVIFPESRLLEPVSVKRGGKDNIGIGSNTMRIETTSLRSERLYEVIKLMSKIAVLHKLVTPMMFLTEDFLYYL